MSLARERRILRFVQSATFLTAAGSAAPVETGFWQMLGWAGNAVFFSRFLVQWYATERRKRVVIPSAFWWLSLTGSLLLLSYSVHKRDPVFV